MFTHFRIVFLLVAYLRVSALLGQESSKAEFTALGDLPGGEVFSEANAVSSNGEVVIGVSKSSGKITEAFRWTRKKGMERLAALTDGEFYSVATAVSADGKLVVGYGNPGDDYSNKSQGFVWGDGGEILSVLTSGTGKACRAIAVSSDGKIVVGDSETGGKPRLYGGTTQGSVAVKWTLRSDGRKNVNGVDSLTYIPEVLKDLFQYNANSFAVGVSSDGRFVVGNCNSNAGAQVAVAWLDGKCLTFEEKDWPPGMDFDVTAVSFDNKVTVGFLRRDQQKFWKFSTDDMKSSLFDGAFRPTCVSNDGKRVFGYTAGRDGYYHTKHDGVAVVWDSQGGMRPIKDDLAKAGLDLDGWVLTTVSGTTPEGSLIVGSGINPEGITEGWIVRLP